MRYITDILARYRGGADYLTGAIAANAEGLINRGIFAAGIAHNESRYKESRANNKKPQFQGIELYENVNPSFAEIKLSYEDQELHFGFMNLKGNDDKDASILAPPPLVTFERSKNTTITIIDDGDESEIVENFGLNSWDIEIEGMLIDLNNHHYPQEALKKLSVFFEINDIITVTSGLFNDLNIHSLWFKKQGVKPVEGFPDTIRFSLSAKSIKPAEFSILNGI